MPEKVNSFNWKKIAKISLQALFVLVVFFFLGRALYLNWNKLDFDFGSINYLYLAFSLLLFIVALLGYALCWNESLRFLGHKLPARRAVKVWYWSQVARYIPGSVWSIFGRIYLGGKEQISKGKVIASIAIETSMLIISSILVFTLSLPFSNSIIGLKTYWPYFVVGSAFFIFLYPPFFNKITDFFVHRIDKKTDFSMQLPFSEIIKLLFYYALVWVIFGLAFFFTINSFKDVGLALIPVFIGIFALSWVLGFLFVIAPGGLGAREVAITLMLLSYFPRPIAIVAAILSRVIMIVAESLILVISSRF